MTAARCRAPFASLYLDPRGFVRVCALNNGSPLGNVGRQSVLDIWRNAAAESLRDEFRSGSWGTGCEVCAWHASQPGEDQSFARTFDQLGEGEADWPRRIEFALGNTCNLRCVMCSGDLSSSIRRRQEGFDPLEAVYDERFFADVEILAPHLREARFLGGEPFLVTAHHRVWDILAELADPPDVHVTTNGTLWNDRVESVLDRFETSIAVSVDGITAETVEAVRVGADHREMLVNIDRFVAYARERGTHLGLTYCLMTENWHEFGRFLAWCDDLDVDAFVNVVTMPFRFSLLLLDPDVLSGVITSLEDERGPDGDGLGRNRHVWVEQLAILRARLAPDPGGDDVAWWRTTADRLDHHIDPPDVDVDRAELADWSDGGPVTVIRLDARDRVVEGDADRFLHLPTGMSGRTFDEVVVLVSSFYGRRTDVGWIRHRRDLEDRTARYETASGVTDLRSISRPLADGGVRMALTARPGRAPEPQPVVLRSSAVNGSTTPAHG